MVSKQQVLSDSSSSKRCFTDASTVMQIKRFVRNSNYTEELEKLQKTAPLLAWFQVSLNWIAILGSFALLRLSHSLWLLVLALIVVGSRQRALNNLMHEAAHNNLFRTKRLNALFSSAFAALPLGESHDLYRTNHMLHHAYLGDPKHDPDYLWPPHVKPGPLFLQAWHFYSSYIFNWEQWSTSLIGAWKRLDAKQRCAVLAWWFVTFSAISLLTNISSAIVFISIWLVSRSTTYHLIRVFAEISDHTGLLPGSITEYTRNIPRSLWNIILHPFGDNYHLLHHLFPNVPTIRLYHLHKILLNEIQYSRLQTIDGYFSGDFPIIKSWLKSNTEG